ncbi:hypothetical protein SELMODRAFT_136205 [Selaginella moellendorffii]|uniref:Inositol-pentakisphosphate 2-kinase n=1 Tax=Selaginella moellendorffii TaxID=88036 RepID=D8TBF3_SELML|nr:hypothetical protein SELMODRAFT_136205 [Selaginella moellendorffii]
MHACGDGALNAAGDWRYKGEGASNVVLDYRGSDSQLLGTVLRIRKAPLRENGGGCAPVLSDLERNLWKDWPAVASSSNEEELRHVYVRDVMRPLLGEDYVDSGVCVIVPVSRKFLEDVSQHIRANRPAWRAEEADLDFSSKNVLAVCDHTLFPGLANESDSPTLSIEIKPKWGYLPQSDAISTENHVKKVVSRFAMHQLLKFVQGKIRSSSSYCPLDLFSGTRDGIIKALNALFKSPQNNLRVFKDGNRIFTGSVDGAQDSTDSSASRDLLERSLVDFTDSVTGQRLDVLEKLIAEILHSSETLRKLLQTQQLDSLDIEGVIHLYYSFVGLHCPECGSDKTGCSIDSDVDKRSVLFASPHSMPADEQRRNLCKFLIAATAKDCSLMVTLKPLDDSIVASSVTRSIISCPTTGRSYVYKISFLDLDLKRLDKIPHYFRLDQSIVKFYAEHTT